MPCSSSITLAPELVCHARTYCRCLTDAASGLEGRPAWIKTQLSVSRALRYTPKLPHCSGRQGNKAMDKVVTDQFNPELKWPFASQITHGLHFTGPQRQREQSKRQAFRVVLNSVLQVTRVPLALHQSLPHLLEPSPEPSPEPDLALHQSLPDLLRNPVELDLALH